MNDLCAYPNCKIVASKESFIRGDSGNVIAIIPTCQPHSELIKLGMTNDRLVSAVQEALSRLFKEKERLEKELIESRQRETRFESLLNEWLDTSHSSPTNAHEKWVLGFRTRVERALLSVRSGDIINDSELHDEGLFEDS